MINYEELPKREYVQDVVRNQSFNTNKEILYFLEKYKYYSAEELTEFLSKQLECQVYHVDAVNRSGQYRNIEEKNSVVISEKGDMLFVIYDCMSDLVRETIELQFIMKTVTPKFVPVTPYNFAQLCGKLNETYDGLQLFKRILIEALEKKATDIHFTVEHRANEVLYPVKFRVDGKLVECDLFVLDRNTNKSVISLLIENNTGANSLDLLTSEGITASSSGILEDDTELRISANKVRDGYHCVMRIQKSTTVGMTISELGFAQEVTEVLFDMANKQSGITLITGAIRTGKNTTAFAMANEMCKKPIKIVSYESPIEVLMPFPQVDYQEDASVLLNAIRLAKKQDVNVAFINEIPTKEVAFAVQDLVNSSISVITTMHMDRVWHLPYKLKEYYGNDFRDVLSQINAVFNQKMFAKSCEHCRRVTLTDSIKNKTIRQYLEKHKISRVYVNEGCEACNGTGIQPGKNQPYCEYVIFDDELVDRLQTGKEPFEMSVLLKERARETSLDVFMLRGIQAGDLPLEYILSIT